MMSMERTNRIHSYHVIVRSDGRKVVVVGLSGVRLIEQGRVEYWPPADRVNSGLNFAPATLHHPPSSPPFRELTVDNQIRVSFVQFDSLVR